MTNSDRIRQENNLGIDEDFNFGVKIKTSSFLDNMLDMYSLPHMVMTRKINNGASGIRQDRNRIKSYFDDAMSKFLKEENV